MSETKQAAPTGYDSDTGNTASQGKPKLNRKNGGKVAEHSKTDLRYWKSKLFKSACTRDGQRLTSPDWSVRIAHGGRRASFPLKTPNAEAAATRALKIYRTIVGAGWDAVMLEHKPQAVAPTPPAPVPATIGEWIQAVEETVGFTKHTLTTYARCLRQIAAEIRGIGDRPATGADGKPLLDRKRRPVLLSRRDYKTGGRDAWVAVVNALPLTVFEAGDVRQWELSYIKRAGDAPDARRRASNSAATIVRNAKALFSAKAREFAEKRVILPNPVPFANVKARPLGNQKYSSKIDAPALIAAARAELTGEPFKIFVLALFCGLRKREVDLLTWGQVDFDKGLIRIERTEYFSPKSEDSHGAVDLDPETIALLRGWYANKTGPFVVESPRQPRHQESRVNYRCTPAFGTLAKWLKAQGVTARKPLHELRKELGALLASSQGIFAAQSVLRHAQISTTAAYYADKKRRITAGLGSLLATDAGNVVEMKSEVPRPGVEPQESESRGA